MLPRSDAFWGLLEESDGHKSHGGHSCGNRNEGGERILDFTDTQDLIIINSLCIKWSSHFIIYYSEEVKTEIDYILVRSRDMKIAQDVLQRIKSNKATGAEDLAAEIWKIQNWLTDFFNKIISEERISLEYHKILRSSTKIRQHLL